jgi:hypothetical protein
MRLGRSLPFSSYWKEMRDSVIGGDRLLCKAFIERTIHRYKGK